MASVDKDKVGARLGNCCRRMVLAGSEDNALVKERTVQ